MTDLNRITKDRDVTLKTKIRIVKAMVFRVATYECETWTIRKAERKKIDAFEMWCWRRLLHIPWTAKRTNQSVLDQIKPDGSLEFSIVKLKLKYFGHIMRREDSLEKSLMLSKVEGKRRRGRQRTRWLDTVKEDTGISLQNLQEVVKDREV